ncbi:MAG: hypothetical protein ACTHQE_11015 [Thermomicrobiales bacterium]
MSAERGEDMSAGREHDLTTPLALRCAALFADRIAAGEVDVVDLPDERAVEIQADEWTLHLEGDPIVFAFVAIEQEPEGADELAGALRTTIAPDDLATLRVLDAELDGTLSLQLAASGDALSGVLAGLLREPTNR